MSLRDFLNEPKEWLPTLGVIIAGIFGWLKLRKKSKAETKKTEMETKKLKFDMDKEMRNEYESIIQRLTSLVSDLKSQNEKLTLAYETLQKENKNIIEQMEEVMSERTIYKIISGKKSEDKSNKLD